ncbi:MAG: HAD-IIIC family phosphatase [Anaerolineales bacterium]
MTIFGPNHAIRTLVDLLRWRAREDARRLAYVFVAGGADTARLTYEDLDRRSRAIGGFLQSLGGTGSRVLLLYPPGLDYIAAFFGCLYAGAVAIPSYPPRLNRPDARLQGIVSDSQAGIALTLPTIRAGLERRFEHTPDLAAVRWEVTDQVDDAWGKKWRAPDVSGDTLAFLQYTSGSTSAPKGVMVTHDNIMHNERMIQQGFEHTEESVIAGWLPIYHDMGLIGNVIQPLYVGAPCYLMSPTEFLQNPYRWLKLLSDTHAHTSGGPNFAYDLCVDKVTPEQRQTLDLSHWQVAFNGSEPVRAQTLERFGETFAPCGFRPEAFYPCYGLAEATLFVSGRKRSLEPIRVASLDADALAQDRVEAAATDDAKARKLVSNGGGWLDEEILIVNPGKSIRCAPGEVGEIWLGGPHVAQGYWQRPEVNRAAFGARLADRSYLRTGDLGFLQDGELFITGRSKDLIILRGRNHYPQDIELTVEQAHPALQLGGGAAFTVEVEGEEQLVVVCEAQRASRNVDVDEVAQAVRQAVSETHELQTYAVVLLRPMSVPKTSSGKIQRHLCRARFLDGSLEVVGSSLQSAAPAVEPEKLTRAALLGLSGDERRARLEEYLGGQVCHILRARSVGREQPLVTLGIDSLLAVELQNILAAGLGVDIPATDFLDGLSVAQLAERILEQVDSPKGEATFETAIRPQVQDGDWPLSFEQERLWQLERLASGNPAYHIPYAIRLRGPLDCDLLEQSLNEIIRRHAALRATFPMVKGNVRQMIAPTLALKMTPVDLRSLPKAEQDAQLRAQVAEIVRRPFDLTNGPLLRAALFRLGAGEHVLVLVLHHTVSDITSLAILLRELAGIYGGAAALPELAIQYGDFAGWQREHSTTAHLDYWKAQLAGMPQKPWLPTDRPRPTGTGRGKPDSRSAQHSFTLPAGMAASLRAWSRQEGATPFTTLLAAFYALLQRYSGQTDLCVGVPTQGRWQPETQNLIGFFAYPLALRLDASGDPTFRQLLGRVRVLLRDAYAHQSAPFTRVAQAVSDGRAKNSAPLFPVMFSLVRTPLDGVEIPGLSLEALNIDDAATDFEWFLTLVEETDGALHGQWVYNTELFTAGAISSLTEAFEGLLAECLEQPDTALAQVAWPAALAPKPAAQDSTHETSAPVRQVLAVAASFTAEPLTESLNFWAKKLGLPLQVAFAPYNQVFQQLLDPVSLLGKNAQGANLVLLRFEDWLRFDERYHAEAGLSEINLVVLEKNLEAFVSALKAAANRSKVPCFVVICPPSLRLSKDANYLSFYQRWERVQAALEPMDGLYFISMEEMAARYPVENYADPQADKLGHIPYTTLFFTALGTMVMRKFHASQRPPYKVIVLDCDQTLWKGVCGEDGWNGIAITPQHRALQEFMLAQREAGMLLCLCSKNDETDVWNVFDRRSDMLLNRQHLVAWRINWQPKSENIRSLADELGLGLDSFIFVDDNPLECADLRARCPQVATLQLPDEIERIPRFLNNVWAFDHLKVTEADRNRSEQYRQNAERERLRQDAPTLDDFLASLELCVEIGEMTSEQTERVAQLTQRTNQFNTTTIRRGAHEITTLRQSGALECLTVQVRDRFGDYGLVGVMLFEQRAGHLWVDTFLLSCRVLGRGVEHKMLLRLGEIAQAIDASSVEIPYRPTSKNQPVLDFLNSVDAKYCVEDHEGFIFRIQTTAILSNNPKEPSF